MLRTESRSERLVLSGSGRFSSENPGSERREKLSVRLLRRRHFSEWLCHSCGSFDEFTTTMNWQKYHPPAEAVDILTDCKQVIIANTTDELIGLACGDSKSNYFEVSYEVPAKGMMIEAVVARVRNGIVANYPEPYMRRRDPDCMVIGDGLP